jgi:uncharacterized protein YcbK (DUF882 family)
VRRNLLSQRAIRARVLSLVGSSLAAVALTATKVAALDESRTLTIFHTHTGESATVTFRRDGSYVPDALKQLNHLLRDWRVDQSTSMEPRLFDIIWEMHRSTGSRAPVHIISAYRSPQTNQALRSRSRAVSEQSQHMLGRAMDIRIPDVDAARVREAAMRLQHGGVGFYPAGNFVHVDVGSVRAWPRMTREQLVRLFPDGRTMHLPADGNPLPGYEQARAEILSRGSSSSGEEAPQRRSLWASLFGDRDRFTAAPQSASLEAGSAAQALAYAPLPPPRPLASRIAPATATTHAPNLNSVWNLQAAEVLPAAHQQVVNVNGHPVRAEATPGEPMVGAVPASPELSVDWEMERAKRNLARRLAERANALRDENVSIEIAGSLP